MVGNREYSVRNAELLNAYSYIPANSFATERFAMETYNPSKNNLRTAVRGVITLPYIEDLKKDEEVYALYRNFISSPLLKTIRL